MPSGAELLKTATTQYQKLVALETLQSEYEQAVRDWQKYVDGICPKVGVGPTYSPVAAQGCQNGQKQVIYYEQRIIDNAREIELLRNDPGVKAELNNVMTRNIVIVFSVVATLIIIVTFAIMRRMKKV